MTSTRISQDMMRGNKPMPLSQKVLLGITCIVCLRYSNTMRKLVGYSIAATGSIVTTFGFMMWMNKPFSQFAVSLFLPGVMANMDKATRKVKSELLKDIHGDVLDFGAGDGQYLNYTARCIEHVKTVVELEPNPNLHEGIRKRASGLGIDVEVFGGFSSDLIKTKGPESFDFIILGNVLCEVPDQQQVLSDIHTLLRKNGQLFFMEHVANEDGTFLNKVQNFLNPVWSVISDGCNCNRHTLNQIKAFDWKIESWELHMNSPMAFINRLQVGIATKKEEINSSKL